MNVNEILNEDNGEPIKSVTGTLKKVWAEKTGEGQYGSWIRQGFVVSDNTGEIVVNRMFSDGIILQKGDEGNQITLSSILSDKHGRVGLVVEEYNGKKQLKMTKTGKIEIEGRGESTPNKTTATVQPTTALTPRGVREVIDQDILITSKLIDLLSQTIKGVEKKDLVATAGRILLGDVKNTPKNVLIKALDMEIPDDEPPEEDCPF